MSTMNGRAPMSRGGVVPGSRMGMATASNSSGSDARPMTSVSGAGYQSASKDKSFDPLHMGKGPAPPLAEKTENSFEDKARDMEKKVHRLFESCAELIESKDMQAGLEKAKEAAKAERALCKFRESHGLVEQINIDLTYAICLNLANAYHQNKMYDEALNTYQLIVKNKLYPQSGRLRVNMGNIYYEQKKYTQAIKMYRMALDQIPTTGKELRHKISRNIANAFVKMGQFQDAIDSYDSVIAGSPDIQTAFNLLLCLYARGDKEKMKKHFTKMLSIPIPGMTEDDEEKASESIAGGNALVDRIDSLREELQRRHELANDMILAASRLIAPVIEDSKDDWILGYKWVMDQLRPEYDLVSSKLEVDLAMMYMKKRRFDDAIEVLKAFEKKDPGLRAMAGTNLSFIYFLEGDYNQAEKHADFAIKSDRYNAKGLVNKGNTLFMMGEYGKAKEYYLEAIGVEADCVEAIFNLGICNLKTSAVAEAHQAFDKLFVILPNAPEALFQLGCIYESTNELEQAAKTFEMLLNKVPGDPNVCARLGQVYEKLEDENTACHWMTEAHRHYPVNLNVISWLGVWYVKRELYEQAIEYFVRAAAVQPGEVKWQLMVTSCYRRLGDYSKALELYQQV
jgi:intraflagellar transport protein 88